MIGDLELSRVITKPMSQVAMAYLADMAVSRTATQPMEQYEMSISIQSGFSVDQPFTIISPSGQVDTTTLATIENGNPDAVRIVYPSPTLGARAIRIDALGQGGNGSNIAIIAQGKRAPELVSVLAPTDNSAVSLGTPGEPYPTPLTVAGRNP